MLTHITLHSTLLEREITAAVGVALEGEVDVVVGALHGGLVVGTQTTILSGKLSAVGQRDSTWTLGFTTSLLRCHTSPMKITRRVKSETSRRDSRSGDRRKGET